MIPHEPTILDKLFPKYFVNAMDGFVAMADSVIEDVKHFDANSKPKNSFTASYLRPLWRFVG